MAIRTKENLIEAYAFERHIDTASIGALKEALARAPGVEFVGQFVGAFTVFARVVAEELAQLQERIAGPYFEAGLHSAWSINLTGDRDMVPKRGSPDICALVRARTTEDPFVVIENLDARFGRFGTEGGYGAAVVTGAGYDLLVDLGAETLEQVVERVVTLRTVQGIGRTSTSLADLRDNALRPKES
jgi:hypothetical protein